MQNNRVHRIRLAHIRPTVSLRKLVSVDHVKQFGDFDLDAAFVEIGHGLAAFVGAGVATEN